MLLLIIRFNSSMIIYARLRIANLLQLQLTMRSFNAQNKIYRPIVVDGTYLNSPSFPPLSQIKSVRFCDLYQVSTESIQKIKSCLRISNGGCRTKQLSNLGRNRCQFETRGYNEKQKEKL